MNTHKMPRPSLEWQIAGVFTGPTPVVPENAPDHVKARAKRYAACQVSVASAGYDHKNQTDRIRFSYKLGWFDDEAQRFEPVSNLPDERVLEFIEALRVASSEAKVAHTNAIKKTKGQLAASIGEQMMKNTRTG